MRMIDKTALITGAGSGIGREMAIAFAREGGMVGVTDTDLDAARNVEREIQSSRGRAQAIQLDVTVEHVVDSAVARFAKEHGSLDVLVANAGVQHLNAIADVSFKDWKRVLAVHLDGSFLTSRAALR
jgi:3-hydroxybutyrate dehydrogenase